MHILPKSIVLFSTLVASWAQAGEFLEQNGVALSRLDALTYFSRDQKLMDGDQQKSFVYKGSKFYFITSAHLDAFKSDPERYAPQFGGYCAYNAAQGREVAANPRVFAIQDGKLYLFSDRESLRHWKEDIAANVARASQAWPALAAARE
jgi:YHS domain-containing protein